MMKRILWIFTGVFILVSRFLIAGNYSGGSGTSGDPYQIVTTEDLIELRNTSADWGAYFIQTADIAFNADETQVDWNNDGSAGPAEGFAPIGNVDTPFTGEYDGGGYTIDNLFINRSASNIALFSKTDGAMITNIGVTHVDITGNGSVGGLVGSNNNSTVSNSYTTGSVSGSSYHVGGLVGYNDNSNVSNCYSTCSVSTQSGFNLDYNVGGLVGQNLGNSTVSNCYSTGSVSGYSDVGGLVGNSLSATISNSYSTGSVSGSSSGGLVGSDDGTINNSFWDTETSGQSSSDGGTGKTTAQMKTLSTFTDAGWDFEAETSNGTDDIWDMDYSQSINNGYPYLSWQDGEDMSLPVTLSTFTAKAVKGTVVLEWETSAEIDNQGFVLSREERETRNERDGFETRPEIIASFTTHDALKGQGSTTETTQYRYVDTSVELGKTYVYTLADVDYSSTETILEKVEVQVEAEGAIVADGYVLDPVYPNPFNASFTLPFTLTETMKVTAVLYNLSGQRVMTIVNREFGEGTHNIMTDVNDLSSGIYFIRSDFDGHSQVHKVMLLK